ncbi:MAG: NAD(P)/FAD-dependent oxidoreductase, partial [Nocardioidaceae bacterium]
MRVIVIGGGIVGAAAAYQLACAGTEVTLVDREDDGQATVVGSGVVFPGPIPGSTGLEHDFGLAAFEALLGVEEALRAEQIEPGVDTVGLVAVAKPGPELDECRARTLSLADLPDAAHVGEIAELAVGAPAERFPLLRPAYAGMWVSGFVRIDGRTLRDGLVSAASARGMTRHQGTANLARASDGVAVRVDGDVLDADAVIVAAGAWSAALCRPLGLDLGVVPHRGQGLRLGQVGTRTDGWPIVQPPDWRFLVPLPGGRVVAGGTSEPDTGFDVHVDEEDAPSLVADALAVAPGLSGWSVVEHRAG